MASDRLVPIDVMIGGQTIRVFRTTNSVNGAPRYIVHYSDLGLKEYVSNEKTRRAGLRKYTGKAFGGGYVFESYYVQESLMRILEILHSN